LRRSFIIWTIAAFIDLYVAPCACLFIWQRKFIYFPNQQRPSLAQVDAPGVREVTLTSSDGLRLLAWYVPAGPTRPTVLYFHGNGGNIGDRAVHISAFAKAGYGFLIPEYRGYGGNPGRPSEQAFFADADTALEFLHAQGLNDPQIIVYGESLGTGVAVHVAVAHPVAALVLEAPYTSLTKMAALRFPYMPTKLLLLDKFDSLARIDRVKAPILILQGDHDTTGPPALGQALFRAAPQPKEIWVASGGGHSNLLDFGAGNVVFDFLDRYLQ
jgi:uncharacterized protein